MNQIVCIFLCTIAILMVCHGLWKGRKVHHRHGFGHKHGSMISVDFYAYASKLRKWNPAFKVVFASICLLMCLICNNIYVSIAVILFMAYIVVVLGGLAFDHYISMMMIPIVFLIAGSIAIAIGFSFSPLGEYRLHVFGWFYIYCTKESLMQAGNIVFKALGAVSAMYMMTLTTPLTELISVLRRLHIPKIMVELMNLIYRYIFIMLETYGRMKNSAESRLGYCDFKTSCYSFGQAASNLLVVSLKKGNHYYNALESRCYYGELHFLEEEKPVKGLQIVGAASVLCILVAIWILTK